MSILYRQNPDMVATEMDGDFVMMNTGTGEYYSIRGSGARMWELASVPISESELVKAICDECNVEEAVCTIDVRKFLTELLEAGLILND
jgi:hypothetical protein